MDSRLPSQDYITTSSGTVTYVRFSEDMESSPQLNIVGISPLSYSQVVPLTYVSTNNSNGDSTWTYGWSPQQLLRDCIYFYH